MAFAGVDISDAFPGDHTMRALKINTNLSWLGLYLAEQDHDPGITRNRKTWIGQFMPMKAMGWGVAPIYMGKQVARMNELTKQQKGGRSVGDFEGAVDGDAAAGFAIDEKLPEKTILYFDLELPGGATVPPIYWEYLASWSRTVLARNYLPGIYCSSFFGATISSKMASMVGNPSAMSNVWIADTNKHQHDNLKNPFPADQAFHPSVSGFANATAWQYAHHRPITVPVAKRTIHVDFNSSIRKDPGRP